ncbi:MULTISPECIES: helix-turn-helix domain-containing protein [Gordonia]|uniref:Putative Xre family DNA binding protein n=1 Tax=Gordonia sputi NBRC 100414 TaxID=1089453 RepID=H5U6Y2_9ACTN|nr:MULTISPECIES: XRE family transcriptional regulator [Gordonia]NKY92870.1 ImmA/IrrE family metallo-endopeptidase [Gordonia sputi]OBA36884.1 XRE family transcriptional regulator [Gordonia sp. 852002-51296_SCH5728562-b]GAB41490.1 putative Xre family DNA binding protein [Gordonia sputi NBRC 100414]
MNNVGDVIITARRAAGITQEELAERLGVTQAALSRYENGQRDVDPPTLAALGRALDLSTDFLTHAFGLRGAIAADAHMRRQKTAKVSDWRRIEAQLNLIRMRSAFLLARVGMRPENHLPTFDPLDTSPVDAARMVRAQWKFPIGPVRNLTAWMESAGILVIEYDFGTHRIDGMSQWAADYPVVIINSTLPTPRKRLTLAHELGHLVLHSEFTTENVEQQANEFAAELLMPEHVIRPELTALKPAKLRAMKRVWGVSMQAIFERAYRMELVSATERTSFYRSMNAKGWKVHEPDDELVLPETPRLAASIGDALVTRGGLSRSEVARMCGRSSSAPETVFLSPDRRLHTV